MWFDVSAAMVRLQISEKAPLLSGMTENETVKIAKIAEVACQYTRNPKPDDVARHDWLYPDAGKYMDFLHLHGPSTYGASATALGWGATRAWQAEAQLLAAGLVQHDKWGKLYPSARKGGA